MDEAAVRLAFADDIEKFMASGKGNTRVLPETRKRLRRLSLRRMRMRMPKPTAHVTAVLPDIYSSPTLEDLYRTRGGIFSQETEKIVAPSQSS